MGGDGSATFLESGRDSSSASGDSFAKQKQTRLRSESGFEMYTLYPVKYLGLLPGLSHNF